MRWLKLWAVLAMAFWVGHFAIAALVAGPPAWTREFFTRLAVVPLLQTAVAGLLLARVGKRAKIE